MTSIEHETTRQINADERNQPTYDRDDNPIQARTLNLNDLAQAYQLPRAIARRVPMA